MWYFIVKFVSWQPILRVLNKPSVMPIFHGDVQLLNLRIARLFNILSQLSVSAIVSVVEIAKHVGKVRLTIEVHLLVNRGLEFQISQHLSQMLVTHSCIILPVLQVHAQEIENPVSEDKGISTNSFVAHLDTRNIALLDVVSLDAVNIW